MELDYFLIKERIKQITTSFSKDGWLTIYESTEDDLLYPCIVHNSKIEEYKNTRDWVVHPYSEGKPAVYGDGKYETYSDEGFEPFIFLKHFTFNGGNDKYVDISEEFVLYFKLYEKAENKQNRKYYFIDELGDLDEVIKVEPNKIQVKLKYLKEYLAIRQVHFSLCFDFMRLVDKSTFTNEIEFCDKDFNGADFFYNHLIREINNRLQSWIFGKKIISFDPTIKSYHFDYENQDYESFITGFDDNGNEIYQDCRKTNDKYFVVTYFKKEVLNKYYNEPEKYEVDGWRVHSNFISLKIDNNNENYVAVFLIELGYLPDFTNPRERYGQPI